jgi:hypothetical protein
VEEEGEKEFRPPNIRQLHFGEVEMWKSSGFRIFGNYMTLANTLER